jgi:very-short-patch-repair endonuclease
MTDKIATARTLRKSMTPQEIILWLHLRRYAARGWRFRRQAPEAGYFLDFVCRDAMLIVECDGAHHGAEEAQRAHDAARDAVLRKRGFSVLRFWNSEIDANLEGVLRRIDESLQAADPTRHAAHDTLPRRGREGGGRYRGLTRLGLRLKP